MVLEALKQAWANYGPWAICGPIRFSIRVAKLEENHIIGKSCKILNR